MTPEEQAGFILAYEHDPDYYDDDDNDAWDEALEECGLLPPHLGGGCQLAGTEHCDFECQFRDEPELLTKEEDSDGTGNV